MSFKLINLLKTKHSVLLTPISKFSTEPIILRYDDADRGIRRLTLNNPKKRNALSSTMIEELIKNLNSDDQRLRAIVIDAKEDGKVFSSGHDLKELAQFGDGEQSQRLFDRCGELMVSISNLPVPVICQVDGLATAAGCQLVASCDMVIATERSHFSTPGADVGLFCSTPGIAISRSANLKMAAYMVLTGRTINAQEALHSGLVTCVVPVSQLHSQTESILDSILSKSREVIAHGKKFFYKQLNMNLTEAYSQGSCVMVENLKLTDGREGIDAFIGKRKPKWSN